jgi:DNA-directed RNA polymerase II subunit RPB9
VLWGEGGGSGHEAGPFCKAVRGPALPLSPFESALRVCAEAIRDNMAPGSRGLKFCPETNDLLYPRENKELRKLEYYCKNCQHVEPAEKADYCVYASETSTFSDADKTTYISDAISDPTLPRTKDVRCPQCQHNEAVFLSTNTEQGMTLYFHCVECK